MNKTAFIATNIGRNRKAIGTYDDEWEEWKVRFFLNGIYQKDATYHTDDREDAIATAHHWADKE